MQRALRVAIDAGCLPERNDDIIGFGFTSEGSEIRFARNIDALIIRRLFGAAARKGYLAEVKENVVGFKCRDEGDGMFRIIKTDDDFFIMNLLSTGIDNGFLPERIGNIIGFPYKDGENVIRLSEKVKDLFIKRLFSVAFNSGYLLDRDSTILDFGCGSGNDVYSFRDLGFDAHGFDIHDYLQLRTEDDRKYFTILAQEGTTISDFRFDWDNFKLPYEDESFDFIFSNQVLEHVQNHDRVFAELARVMKPVSLAIHIFPPKYAFKEPHIFVPLGSWITSRPYYLFWALLGVRNQYQAGLSAQVVADENYRYARQGLNYLSPRELLAISRRHFPSVMFVPDLWEQGGRLARRLKYQWYHRWYLYTKNTVLRMEKSD